MGLEGHHGKKKIEELYELTGSVLRPSQPFSLWIALDTDDVQRFSLLQSKVSLTAFAIHTGLPLVDDFQGANQLIHTAMYKHICKHTQKKKRSD